MKDIKKILSLIVFCWALNLNAQTSDSVIKKSTNLKLSYNSSLTYPGARIGFELPVRSIELKKIKSNGEKEVIKDRFITTQLGWYHHPSFHDNLYFTFGWTMRRIRYKGFFTEFCPEIGYSRTFLGGTTYTVNANNEVSVKRNAGYDYALVSLGFGFGYDYAKIKSKPFSAFCKLNVISLFPYNSTFYLRPAMEIGVIYKPKIFVSFNTKKKRTIKPKK